MCTIFSYVQKYKKKYTNFFQFLQLKKNLYITWACFRNVLKSQGT